jgi:hypothetical protein
VILLVLVGLLWVAVLAPSAWRRFSERQSVGSIDHFHHQLQLLEHAAPKTVTPAYRLHTAVPGRPGAGAPPVADSSRPKLVLLRPAADAETADVDDGEGGHYERVGVLDPPEPACLPEVSADLGVFRRERARRRGTTLLRCLCGLAVSTGLIGLFPKMHLAWIFTALSGLAALGLVGLMAYAKELEAQQRHRRARAERATADAVAAHGWTDAATSGLPGACDDDVDEARVAAR